MFKKFPGVIFPAFPDKGIVSYVKTKVLYQIKLGDNSERLGIFKDKNKSCGKIYE